MMRRFTRSILAVGLAVLGMMATNTPPVSAISLGIVDFAVVVTTPGLGYVVVTPPQSGGVAITTTTACVGASVGKKINAGTCFINGAGSITGNCGQSIGWITGTIHMTGVANTWWNYTIHFITAGEVIEATGTVTDPNTGQTGPIVVEGVAAPTAGSCLSGSANQFQVVGTADFAKL